MTAPLQLHSGPSLAGVVKALLPDPRIAVEEAPIRALEGAVNGLSSREYRSIAEAVPKRQREFAAGRLLARRALRRLGVTPVPIIPRSDRAPIWPSRVIGSIAHTDDWCAVATAFRSDFAAIGIDIEPNRGLAQKLWRQVLTEEEILVLKSGPESTRGAAALLAFCAKEALYKAQYTISREFVEFREVEVTIDPTQGCFRAVASQSAPGWIAGRTLSGRLIRRQGLVGAAVTIASIQRDLAQGARQDL